MAPLLILVDGLAPLAPFRSPMLTHPPVPSVRDQALSFVGQVLSASENVAQPCWTMTYLERLRPLFATGP